MAFTTASANAQLKQLLQGIGIAGLSDNAVAGALANLFIGLYTSNPGAAANQSTNEISYTGYVRKPVPRSALGWVIAGDIASLVNAIEYDEMTAGVGGTVTHLGLGTLVAGAGLLLVTGQLDNPIPVAVGVVPRLKTTTKVQFLAG